MGRSQTYRQIREDRRAARPRSARGWVSAYVSLCKTLEFRTTQIQATLKTLLVFMRRHGVTSFNEIDRQVASAWLRAGTPQESTIGSRLSIARGFFKYLSGLDAVRENIWTSLSPPRSKRFIPHIYSISEIQLILGHVRGLIDPRKPKRSHVYGAYHAMLHTLYACGLRASEACRLALTDVDFKKSLFVVKNTKFGKTRLVPFNWRTGELLYEYLDVFRRHGYGMEHESALFLNYRGHHFSTENLLKQCQKACGAVGVLRRRKIEGNTVYGSTNLHAFRHTFAVHRLLKWYYEGADVNSKLPLLATYMGHAHYHYTQRYLTILPMFVDIAGKLFADKYESPLADLERNLRCVVSP